MREIPQHIWDIWNAGGPAVGRNGAPHGRVTVEINWQLTAEEDPGSYDRGNIRWWQRADNSQVETEIPNIDSINIDRSLDQDAATCEIVLSNQWHHLNGSMATNDVNLGVPGYFTFSHGDSVDAQTMWDQTPNEWSNVIIPDALLRTYQGYGGRHKTVVDAITDGNIVLTGVWLIDEVRIGTDGKVRLKCRDMAKLLIEQQIYPPLAPADLYPIKYCRWGYSDLGSDLTLLNVINPLGEVFAPNVTEILGYGTTDYAGPVPEPNYPNYEGNEPGNGYWLLVNDGNVYAMGNNVDYGDATAVADWETNPANAIESTITGDGYWIVCDDGQVIARGDATAYADATIGSHLISLARTYHGDGLWLIEADGSIHVRGAAVNLGEPQTNLVNPNWWESEIVSDMAGDPLGLGYWTLTNEGRVEAFGSAVHYGHPYGTPAASNVRTFIRIVAHPNGAGYWVIDQIGRTHAYGQAQHYGQLAGQAYVALGGNLPYQNPDFPDYMSCLIPTPSGNGYWLTGISGGVYPMGDAVFYGALNGPYESFLRTDGNYEDYVDVVEELLLWGGFWLYDSLTESDAPSVYGNLESTGAFGSDCLPDDMLDKRPLIDPITRIKEIVGYIFYVDDEGAVHFESPNIYSPGNFTENGEHTSTIPELSESVQITNYGITYSDKSARSEIIISTAEPTAGLDDTLTTRFTPSTSEILRGIVKPGMWINGVFTTKNEQEIMAELIALYSWLAQRQSSVTIMANPAIQINDQVRIYERITSETYIHYVRGISSNMDLLSGSYTMTLTTHWMGDDSVWAVDLGLVPYDFREGITPVPYEPVSLDYIRSTSDLPGVEEGTETLDGNLATYWTVPGNSGQLLDRALEYIEYEVNSEIDVISIYPFGAGVVYISVMEGGVWQSDAGTIPYDPISPPGAYSGPYAADIGYVTGTILEDDVPEIIVLPRVYDAQRVRVTLSFFTATNWGPQHYVGGLREVEAGLQ